MATPDEKEESGKDNLDDEEESKPAAKTVLATQLPPLTDGKDKAVIFHKKVKSKFVAATPALSEQNVQNIKNKNREKK